MDKLLRRAIRPRIDELKILLIPDAKSAPEIRLTIADLLASQSSAPHNTPTSVANRISSNG
jgi:hypothetical protein